MASPTNAIENNNKQFPLVASKLSKNDPKIYTSVSKKLTKWLSNEKAYYSTARPEIIRLLGIAHSTLRIAVGADPAPSAPFHISAYSTHPMVGPYSRLLKAVHPFKHLFIEEDLREQLQHLINTITLSSAMSNAPSHPPAPTSVQSPLPISPPGHSRTMMQPSSSSLASAFEMGTSPHNPLAHITGQVLPADHVQQTGQGSMPEYNSTPEIVRHTSSNDTSGPMQHPFQSDQFTLLRPSFSTVALTQTLHMGQNTSIPPRFHASRPISVNGSIDLTQEGSASPSLIPAVSGSNNNDTPAIAKKKKKKRQLPSQILAKDIEEYNRKRFTNQPTVTIFKQEPSDNIDLSGETARASEIPSLVPVEETSTISAHPATHMPAIIETQSITADVRCGDEPPKQLSHTLQESANDIATLTNPPIHVLPVIEARLSTAGAQPSGETPEQILLDNVEVYRHNFTGSVIAPNFPLHQPEGPQNESPCESTPEAQTLQPVSPTTIVQDEAPSSVDDFEMKADNISLHKGIPASDIPGYEQDISHVRDNETDTTRITQDDVTEGGGEPICAGAVGPVGNSAEHCVIETTSSMTAVQTELSSIEVLDAEQTTRDDAPVVEQSDVVLPFANTVVVPSDDRRPSKALDDSHLGVDPPLPTPLEHSSQSSPDTQITPNSSTSSQPTGISAPVEPLSLWSATLPSSPSRPQVFSGILFQSDTDSPGPKGMTPQILSTATTHNITNTAPTKDHNLPEDSVITTTGPEKILATQESLVDKSKITITFHVPEEQYRAVKTWNNRRNSRAIGELNQSICFSFACFSTKTSEKLDIKKISKLKSLWPQAGNLSMNVSYGGKRKKFPLSPPFITTSDGLVDVSEFLQQGVNIIEIQQPPGMVGWTFVLRCHHPTHSQLEDVVKRQQKNQEWQYWLQQISRPLDLSIPVFS